jgi:hypothetical protein
MTNPIFDKDTWVENHWSKVFLRIKNLRHTDVGFPRRESKYQFRHSFRIQNQFEKHLRLNWLLENFALDLKFVGRFLPPSIKIFFIECFSELARPQSYININRVSYRHLDWLEGGWSQKKIGIFVAFAAPSSSQVWQFY